MKKFLCLAALAFTLASCGQQEKSPDPFGRTDNEQQNPGRSERAFKEECSRKKGSLVQNESICVYTSVARVYPTREEVDKIFKNADGSDSGVGFKMLNLGNSIPAGAKLYADKEGGHVISFFMNGNHLVNLESAVLSPRLLPAGKLEMRIYRGNYEYLNVFVDECFTRTVSNVQCPL